MQEQMIARAKALLNDSTVDRVLGWKVGEFSYDLTPAVFESAEELDNEFIYNTFFREYINFNFLRAKLLV